MRKGGAALRSAGVKTKYSQSFDFVIAAFTAPARPLLTPAAAQESLVGAPGGTLSRTRVEGVNKIAVPMVNGVAQCSKAS